MFGLLGNRRVLITEFMKDVSGLPAPPPKKKVETSNSWKCTLLTPTIRSLCSAMKSVLLHIFTFIWLLSWHLVKYLYLSRVAVFRKGGEKERRWQRYCGMVTTHSHFVAFAHLQHVPSIRMVGSHRILIHLSIRYSSCRVWIVASWFT